MAKTRFEIVSSVIDAEMAKPYTFGTADCFFFGCRVADALDTNLNLAETFTGRYRSARGAQRALRKEGHTSLVGLFSGHLDACPPAQARIGDLAVIVLSDGEHVGVCVGQKFITKTARGQSFHDMATVSAAFRAG